MGSRPSLPAAGQRGPGTGPRISAAARGRVAALIAALAALARPLPAAAIDWLIERPVIDLVSEYEVDAQQRKSLGNPSAFFTHTASSAMVVSTQGWVYHPALVVFTSRFRPELERRNANAKPGVLETSDDLFLGYDLDSTWFQFKPISFGLGATRERETISNRLSPDTKTRRNDYRAFLRLKLDPFPTTVRVTRSESTSTTRYTEESINHEVSLLSRYRDARQRADLRASLSLEERSALEASQIDRSLDSSLRHQLDLSPRATLTSRLRFDHDRAKHDVTQRTFETGSELAVQVRDNLRWRAGVSYQNRISAGFSSKRTVGEGSLSHRLYENLTTRAGFRLSRDRQASGPVSESSGKLDLAYVRRIPWGYVHGSLGRNVILTNDRRDAGLIRVSDESLTLNGTARSFLANLDIEPASIEVTNLAATVRYLEGIDYLVTTRGRRVALTRTVGSAITDGETVLVDYQYAIGAPAKTRLTTDSFGFGLILGQRLFLDYRVMSATESLLSGFDDQLIDDLTRSYSARLDWGISSTQVRYEDIDSVSAPSKEWTVREELNLTPARGLALRSAVQLANSEELDTGNIEDTLQVNATLRWFLGRWPLGRDARLEMTGDLRLIRGDVQSTNDAYLLGTLRWRFGAWKPSIEVRLRRARDNRSRQIFHRNRVLLRVERRLDFR